MKLVLIIIGIVLAHQLLESVSAWLEREVDPSDRS